MNPVRDFSFKIFTDKLPFLKSLTGLIFLFVLGAVFLGSQISEIKIGDAVIKVEIRDTKAEQAQGLSGRTSLAEDTGMLFVFDAPGQHSFWMKDMNFAIDMIWFDNERKIIYIKENALPSSYPESFGPERDSMYVLETVSGFVEKNNLKIGDTFSFE